MKKILYVGSECTPFASSGGLGEVLGSLPAAVCKAANGEFDVRVVMPLYSKISDEWRKKMKTVCEFYINLSWRRQYCGVKSLKLNGVVYYFIDNEYYFKRDKLYGSYDDGERFAYFCRAVIDMLWQIDFIPDILHANDWQSALSIIYIKEANLFPGTKCIYTIHNIDYQGIFSDAILGDVFGISEARRSIVDFKGCINLTKGAIVSCDKLTTVSEKYSEEIQNPYFGTELNSIIRSCSYKLTGIVNGIDYKVYNPRSDKTIAQGYSKSNPAGKAVCKRELQKMCSLPERDDVPVIAMVSRLAAHKGFELVRCVMDEILKPDIQFVLLGSGEREYEDFFRYTESVHPDKMKAFITFDIPLSKKVYAGSDLFLMPSKSEPCGLAQMMASRYGSIPIVHEVGGLYDTIKAFDETTGTGNGVTFKTYNAHDMLDGVRRAVAFYNNPAKFKKLRSNSMSMDFSWNSSAEKYLKLYEDQLK